MKKEKNNGTFIIIIGYFIAFFQYILYNVHIIRELSQFRLS